MLKLVHATVAGKNTYLGLFDVDVGKDGEVKADVFARVARAEGVMQTEYSTISVTLVPIGSLISLGVAPNKVWP